MHRLATVHARVAAKNEVRLFEGLTPKNVPFAVNNK